MTPYSLLTLHRPVVLIALLLLSTVTLAQPEAETVRVVKRYVQLSLSAEAVIEATKQATVATQVSGRIVEVKVEAGQTVTAGQMLMRIDAREAAQNAAASRARLAQAEADFKRNQDLFRKKFISRSALDAAETELKAARAEAAAAGAGQSHATISAPISGLVAVRHAELGELAVPGKPLLTLFDPQGLRAVASIPQYKLKAVREAKLARLEFPEVQRWLDALNIEILPTVNAQSHTATIRVHLPQNAATLKGIVPGMAARLHFIVGEAEKLTVPPAAILRRGEITAVYVQTAQGPQLRQIRLGEAVADGEVEVLSGLVDGETISLNPVMTGIALKQQTAR